MPMSREMRRLGIDERLSSPAALRPVSKFRFLHDFSSFHDSHIFLICSIFKD